MVDTLNSIEYNECSKMRKEELTVRMENDVRVTVRVDKNLKDRADSLFERLGLNMTTALNVFLRKAVDENAIPFPVSAKPAGFGPGLTADEIIRAF
jgi:addiction module RelB/DinJ family antitoxin